MQVRSDDINERDVLRDAAADSDGVVHHAFGRDIAFTGDFDIAIRRNLVAIKALGDALAGSGRPLAIASGVAGLKPGCARNRE